MSTRELIETELQTMNEEQLRELYQAMQQISQSEKSVAPLSLMAKLKQIKIQAPEDFATNLR